MLFVGTISSQDRFTIREQSSGQKQQTSNLLSQWNKTQLFFIATSLCKLILSQEQLEVFSNDDWLLEKLFTTLTNLLDYREHVGDVVPDLLILQAVISTHVSCCEEQLAHLLSLDSQCHQRRKQVSYGELVKVQVVFQQLLPGKKNLLLSNKFSRTYPRVWIVKMAMIIPMPNAQDSLFSCVMVRYNLFTN
eukprot:jgi/Galph1/262/GphlegSOOS_G5011.1